ncbi:deoxycytidine triphosphate deaminase [Nocardia terpenica]|uniref:PEP/pyruvate-binding domain-containing protein n=1 Tax=Nocardia terpenica TaxID=455432 RepID=UPI001894C7B6|nr:PEP/pyruvate-binding domain-containing protein [Nocardia terpenica]MBF6063534.1 deoxycytidine triphosphate deaminase [Nocardia terpenica]MBF6106090.1 deoxycytidine triphosphate deaminase [Nocardia terpenica]MBF6113325.1 deoxycytidine triphosphate deaminase [Nocardia terpenica]MBF6119831.1 deoxycytidine triphosphate deaminase [Nocardia terpenica]MBF6152242.1 deoxycytidine triphosphate deaminase [Nocardia terpenica]
MTILTGEEIRRQWQRGAIRIDPFDESRLNPNSYNFTLGDTVRVYSSPELDARVDNPTTEILIPHEGFVLEEGRLYLAATAEVLGGAMFAPTFSARSSIARLGLSIHLSSGLGDIGYVGHWTLQLLATAPVRVYPGMEIGQMMWWVPSGDIICYNGKYQGAQGPRASESWRTLDRDVARIRFPGTDGPGMDPARVGAKAATLARLAPRVPVPDLVAVTATEFTDALAPQTVEQIKAIFSDLQATVGANIVEDAARLAELLADIALPVYGRELLARRLSEVFTPQTRFAVRSSAAGEDSTTASHAGVYDSVLDVAAADVPAAVAAVWRSYYSLAAVTTRLRGGDLDPAPRMAVIVQAMIEPDIAGIAITGLDPTDPDRVHIEAVRGRADALAGGVATPDHNLLSASDAARIGQLVDAVRTQLGRPAMDIEWVRAGDQQLYVVQARPNTARHTGRRTEPAVVRLYDEPIPADIPLGPIGPAVAHFIAKRRMAVQLATTLDLSTGVAFVVYVPADPESSWYSALATVLDPALDGARVIVDASEFERQTIIDYAHLHTHLERLLATTPVGEPLTLLVRQYVTGHRGVISRHTGGEYYAETSTDGLLAMNRGTAACTEIRFTADMPAPAASIFGGTANVRHMVEFSTRLEQQLGPVTVEWVVDPDGTVHYIDHTVLGTGHPHAFAQPAADDALMLAEGRCVGRVVRVTDDAVLQRLSVAPAVSVSGGVDVSGHRVIADAVARAREIRADGAQVIISARHPYAILAALVGHVDGFLFDSAPRLCHLAIILRENHIPAAVHHARHGTLVMLDDGAVYTLTPSGDDRP